MLLTLSFTGFDNAAALFPEELSDSGYLDMDCDVHSEYHLTLVSCYLSQI